MEERRFFLHYFRVFLRILTHFLLHSFSYELCISITLSPSSPSLPLTRSVFHVLFLLNDALRRTLTHNTKMAQLLLCGTAQHTPHTPHTSLPERNTPIKHSKRTKQTHASKAGPTHGALTPTHPPTCSLFLDSLLSFLRQMSEDVRTFAASGGGVCGLSAAHFQSASAALSPTPSPAAHHTPPPPAHTPASVAAGRGGPKSHSPAPPAAAGEGDSKRPQRLSLSQCERERL